VDDALAAWTGVEVGTVAVSGSSVGKDGDGVDAAVQARITTANMAEEVTTGSRSLRRQAVIYFPLVDNTLVPL